MKKPGTGDTVLVADHNSAYRGKQGTVASGPVGEYFMVTLNHHAKPVRLRFTQLKILTEASSRSNATPVAGNDPTGRPLGKLTTPTGADRRDTPGSGYQPSDVRGTLGDTRPALA